jgi:TolB-like protein/Tfp pilus assembly protein PilF
MKALFQELRRRKVFTIATAYVVVAWVLIQVSATVLPIYETPGWILKAFTTLLFLGFPVALLLAWAYDVTPGGIVRTEGQPVNENNNAQDKALSLPSGPTITVLPFKNLSSDADQELFAQAMTNDIVTGLTQSSSLCVVSSGATSDADFRDIPPADLGKELGVRYLLQGSVNKVGDKLRVTAQLSETKSNVQMWSGRYDKELSASSLFDVQDDIREQIVATLSDFHGVIYLSETQVNIHRPTDSLNAYECLSVALAYDKFLSEEYHLRARESLEHAVELDPEFDQAWSHLSWIYTDEVVFDYNPLPNSMERALKAARRAVELAPDNYHNHWLLSRVHYFSGERDRFFAEAEKALRLNANDGTTLGLIGAYMAVSGEWERGVALLEKAKVLNPKYPDYYHLFLGAAELNKENYSGALSELQKMTIREWPLALIFLAASSALTDNMEDAMNYLEELASLQGEFTMDSAKEALQKFFPYASGLVATVLQGLGLASDQQVSS